MGMFQVRFQYFLAIRCFDQQLHVVYQKSLRWFDNGIAFFPDSFSFHSPTPIVFLCRLSTIICMLRRCIQSHPQPVIDQNATYLVTIEYCTS